MLPADGRVMEMLPTEAASFGLSTDAATSGKPTDERRGATAAAATSRRLQLPPGLIDATRRRNSDDRASGKQEDARLKREVLKNDNDNKSTPRDPPRPLFTSPSHRRDDDDCDSYDSEFSDVASASSSFHDGEIRKKRTNSGDAKLLLRLNRVNRFLLPPSRLVNQRRQGAQEGRFSHPNKSESRIRKDDPIFDDDNNNGNKYHFSKPRSKPFRSNVGSYESMRKRANWEDAGSPTRTKTRTKTSDVAGSPTRRKPESKRTIQEEDDSQFGSGKGDPAATSKEERAQTKNGGGRGFHEDNDNNNKDEQNYKEDGVRADDQRLLQRRADDGGSHVPGAGQATYSGAGQARQHVSSADADANRKWMAITILLVFIWFLYSFVYTRQKPCVSCIFGLSSVDGGAPKF